MTETAGFGDTLAARVAGRESQLVLGLDPDPRRLWVRDEQPFASGTPVERAARAVTDHCRSVIEATAAACVAVKLQLARFEVLGVAGWRALVEVAQEARAHGLLVIADGKRGDIDVSAEAYAQALTSGVQTPFGALPGLEADLLTVNPLMGRDAVAPFIAQARARGAGVLLLVRTSNAGAADVQDLVLQEGVTVWERLAVLVDELGSDGVGEAGVSDVGAVFGATAPSQLPRARELMGRAPFLLPGIGAQGGRVEDLAAAFDPGRAGGLVSASRSIVNAHENAGGDPATAAREEAERLRAAAWTLSGRAAPVR